MVYVGLNDTHQLASQSAAVGFSPGSGKGQQKRLTVIVSGFKNADSCGI